VCIILAHLRPHTDIQEHRNTICPIPTGTRSHVHFKERIQDLFEILDRCDAWYKKTFHLVDSQYLPFNILLEGNLNFRTIKQNTNNIHDNEGQIVLRNLGFSEQDTWDNFPYTFKLKLCAQGTESEYNSKRNKAWTDPISVHNGPGSGFRFVQCQYGIPLNLVGVSNHFPVFFIFDSVIASLSLVPIESVSTVHTSHEHSSTPLPTVCQSNAQHQSNTLRGCDAFLFTSAV